jgi:hypothetical protein
MAGIAASAVGLKKSSAHVSHEQISPRTWGIGLILGEPTGVTAKYWRNNSHAYNFSLGAPLGSGVGIFADYLIHIRPFSEIPEVPIYAGGGVFFQGGGNDFLTGVRGVFGIAYMFDKPFDVFFEFSPKLGLLPELDFAMRISLGGRIYFDW